MEERLSDAFQDGGGRGRRVLPEVDHLRDGIFGDELGNLAGGFVENESEVIF